MIPIIGEEMLEDISQFGQRQTETIACGISCVLNAKMVCLSCYEKSPYLGR